ncbi:protein DMP7 [Eucalyptus grandis]|uniref:protein DMP7 n=1 Tax=Eucalyptus grandis TaxID=71139 RepID=UPI00192EAF71|nr:protein DMP7 [Eucalyptus grandis]
MEAPAQEQGQSLLRITGPSQDQEPRRQPKTPAQKAVRKTFKLTAHLANLLPTGTVLAFQVVSPVLTHQGKCPTSLNHTLTLALLALCAASCFFLSFTDSIRDERGKVRHGIATFKGLLVLDASVRLSPEEADRYRIRLLDLLHGVMSVLVFAAIALFDPNVVRCFYPSPSEEARRLLMAVPIGVGVACSLVFLAFPTKRHGIGFPLTRC